MLEFLAGFTDGRRIDDGHHFFNVIHDDSIEQVLIAILQRQQVKITFEVGRFGAYIAEDPKFLFGHGVDARRQQASQFQRVALRICKGGTFVAYRVVENFNA